MESWLRYVGSILRELAPIKTYQVRRNFSDWLNDDIKEKIKDRNEKRELARISGNPAHWKEYRISRNHCTNELRKLKVKHHRQMYEKFEKEKDTKSIYRTTKKLLNFNVGGSPQCFMVEGNPIRRPVDLANTQMNFFVEKVRKLSQGLVDNGTNPLKWLQTPWPDGNIMESFRNFNSNKSHSRKLSISSTN